MDDRIKHRLGEEQSQKSTNVDSYMKIQVSNSEETLPVGEINHILDVGERFDKERQTTPYYRLMGTIRPLISNVLFNISGDDSWSSFDTAEFKDQSYPSGNSDGVGTDIDDLEDITYKQSIKKHLKEIDGWFGFYDPNTTKEGLCNYTDMEPKRTRFSFKKDRYNDNKKNWEVTVTYPSSSATTELTTDPITGEHGLLIFDIIPVTVSKRDMIAIGVPVLHNLEYGEIVRITGTTFDGEYTVQRIGLDNGDLKGYYFVIDVDPSSAIIGTNSRMNRLVSGEPSKYYFRLFEKIKTRVTSTIEDDDYEIYPLNFANNIYNDNICQFVFNEDIDVSDLTDNLGRPLSELYITIVKTNGLDNTTIGGTFNGFTEVKSGIEVPYMPEIQATSTEPWKVAIPDVRRIHEGGLLPTMSHTPLETNINITYGAFYGDVVEYNRFTVKEIILGEVYHRFNTVNRIGGGGTALGPRQEGYYYKAHYPIKIRNFSSYIEQGDSSTAGIPDYAEDLGDGRFLWRDLLTIGFNEGQEDPLDYPFLNGAHYIYNNYCIALRRQDPFGFYGLYYADPNGIDSDPAGDMSDDNFTTNKSDNVC